jgi:hypothetical protein
VKELYALVLSPVGSGRSSTSESVKVVNLSQLAFLKFHRFLLRLLILMLMSQWTRMGQWPERGNLSRTILPHSGAMSVETNVRSGFDHFLCLPE